MIFLMGSPYCEIMMLALSPYCFDLSSCIICFYTGFVYNPTFVLYTGVKHFYFELERIL